MTPANPDALADGADDLIARLRATNPWTKTAIAEDLMREAAGALQRVTAERDTARAENDRFRAGLANGGGPCAYCSLSREDWAKCRSGLPGCDRADDAMLCPHFGAEMEAHDRAAAAEARAAQLQAEVEAKDRVRWLPIATAPTDRPVVVRMKTDRLQGGWFVATVTLPDPDDDSRFGSCSTIWHYNGDTLLTQFRGTWTEWLDDGGSDRTARAALAATAREGA